MKGRKPIPDNVHILHGNPGKRKRSRDRLDIPATTIPKRLDPIAKREWRRLAPILRKLGLLTVLDRAAFEIYCRVYSDWIRYSKKAEKAPVVKLPSGRLRVSPWWELAEMALKNLRAFATEFGLTPSSRARIKIPPPEPGDDDFDKFMGEK